MQCNKHVQENTKEEKHNMFHFSDEVLKEIERNLIEFADLYAILEDINPEGFIDIDLTEDYFSIANSFYQLDPDEYPFLVYYVRKE